MTEHERRVNDREIEAYRNQSKDVGNMLSQIGQSYT